MNELAERQQYEVTQSRDVESAVAEIQSAMVIAQKFPRKVTQARHDILNACARPKLAETALYQYARGGTTIKGPSIRLAEVLAQNWGNMSFGLRELINKPRDGERWGESQVQAFCWDMQTNTKREIMFSVPHIRKTRSGTTILDDPRDVYELIANQGARRMRACILAIIPGDIIEEAVEAIEATLTSNVELTDTKRASCLEKFAKYGVSKAQLEAFIQRKFEAIQPTQFVTLGRIFTSLKDGQSKPGEWFDAETGGEGSDEPAQSRSDSVKAQVKASAGNVDTATGEISEADNLSAFRDFNVVIDEAATVDEINAIEVDIGNSPSIGSKDRVILLNALIAKKESISNA